MILRLPDTNTLVDSPAIPCPLVRCVPGCSDAPRSLPQKKRQVVADAFCTSKVWRHDRPEFSVARYGTMQVHSAARLRHERCAPYRARFMTFETDS